jgi:signal transduction histidine kinase/DNA-binding response OmpR family regulator
MTTSADPVLTFEQIRRIRLINLFSIIASISTIPYLFVFSGESRFLIPISIIALGGFLSCILLNQLRYYRLARYVLLFFANAYIFSTASTFGRENGDQLIYLPIIFGTVLVYDFSEKVSLSISILFTLACLVCLELTNYHLLSVPVTAEQQLAYYYGNLLITFTSSIIIALFYFKLYASQNIRNEEMIQTSKEIEKTINYFSTSLYGKNSEDEIFWDIAKNCIASLGFQDCVVYAIDDEKKRLIQKAAYGPKNPTAYEIANAIEIPIGKGIVGTVALTGVAEIIQDTTKDRRYITDDEPRFSEITVPIIYQGTVIGVIDCEHKEKNFFTQSHLNILNVIASFCSNKIIKARAEEEKVEATIAKLEAEKIVELDKVKSKFFKNISHEFRTPLTLILAPLDEMISRETDATEVQQLKMMQFSARKLLRLINDLLELSKLNEGMLTLDFMKEDIFSFVRTVVSGFHSLARQRKIDLEIIIPSYALVFEFDLAKIETIIINLLSNTLAITPVQGKITVGASLKNDRVEIFIKNIGGEILDDLDKIFDRSYSRKNDERINELSGIGLFLSKELAELHGGNLWVEKNEGNGNTFTLTIPAVARNEEAGENNPIDILDAISPTALRQNPFIDDLNRIAIVLIVEDNDDLRNYLVRILKPEFNVLEAINGEEGHRTALNHVPDLVISDVMMPIMDGLQLCKNLKADEVTSHIPVILLTARADMESKLEGLDMGADYYLAKPFQARELLAVAGNLITQRKKLKESFGKTVLLKTDTWEGSSSDDRFLQKLVKLIEAHLSEPDFTVEELQKELGISRMQLHRKLKALTDLSATEFIRSLRLKRAAEMLEKGQDNVSQIAYQVGFNSLSYFSKCFKEQYGVLPSHYVKKLTH